jgi:hypothetical protein
MTKSPEGAKMAGGPPIYYGKNPGQTPLDASTVYPLLAAWLLLTTNGPASTVQKATISRVANIDPRSVDVILQQYNKYPQSFSDVRTALGVIAAAFASGPPYSGGQCPEVPETIGPVAGLP